MSSEPALNLPTLPDALRSGEALRLRAFLRAFEVVWDGPLALHIFGSAAVSLYLAADSRNLAETKDIDVAGPPATFQQRARIEALTPQVRVMTGEAERGPLKRLHFEFTPLGALFFVGPDWLTQLVDVSAWLGLSQLSVSLLHPADLILSKMSRGQPRDVDDCLDLYARYFDAPHQQEQLTRYFYKAFAWAHSDLVEQELIEMYEEVFGRAFEPERVDRSPTNL